MPQPGSKVRRKVCDRLVSTNLEAKRLAKAGNVGPLWIMAREQTGGVGRRGRSWVSQKGNLFASGLYPHSGNAQAAAQMSFVAALAVHETINHYIDAPSAIKWPNDVLAAGRKISGILLESGQDKDKAWLVVGIGINLAHAPQLTDQKTSCLADWSQTVPKPEQALDILINSYEHWREQFERGGFAPIRSAWLARAHGLGGPVIARLPNKTISGKAIGLDVDGALEIETAAGERIKIHAGDVFFS